MPGMNTQLDAVAQACYLAAPQQTLLNRRLAQVSRRPGDPVPGRIAGFRHSATLFCASPSANPGSAYEREVI